jgi:hypothetical protein
MRAADHAVNARDLPGRFTATTRPGGLPEVVTRLWESPGRDGPHEDTAQDSAYEVIAGRSISAGYDSDSMLAERLPQIVGPYRQDGRRAHVECQTKSIARSYQSSPWLRSTGRKADHGSGESVSTRPAVARRPGRRRVRVIAVRGPRFCASRRTGHQGTRSARSDRFRGRGLTGRYGFRVSGRPRPSCGRCRWRRRAGRGGWWRRPSRR